LLNPSPQTPQIKVIFERLVRRCGHEAVSAVTPPEHQKLITNIRKTRDRLERKKRESEAGSEKSGAESMRSKALTRAATARRSEWSHGDVFSDDDEGFGGLSDDEDLDGATTVGGATSAGAISKGGTLATRASRKARKLHARLPEEDESGPLDLLDVQRTRRVMSAAGRGRKAEEEEGGDFDMDPDGRLVIAEEGGDIKKRKRDAEDMDVDEEDYIGSQSGKSRARSKKSSEGGGRKAKGGEGKVNLSNKARKLQDGRRGMTGDEYRAGKGKGGGDARGKKKLEPFAYWPLDPKMLNRREGKRADARKGMSDVLKTGKKKRGVGVDRKRAGIRKGHKAHKGK
jgi:ribosomal RNA-processing protein 12